MAKKSRGSLAGKKRTGIEVRLGRVPQTTITRHVVSSGSGKIQRVAPAVALGTSQIIKYPVRKHTIKGLRPPGRQPKNV